MHDTFVLSTGNDGGSSHTMASCQTVDEDNEISRVPFK